MEQILIQDKQERNQEQMVNVAEIYKHNKAFREYLERHMRHNPSKSLDECLEEKMIIEIAKEYEEGGCNYREENIE